MTTLAIIW